MKENYTQLYPNEQVAKAVGDYAFEHSTKLPQHITDYHAWGSTQEKASFMISPFQAQFHSWVAKAVGAKRILEIGSYIGFSTMVWVDAVGPDGHVTALEFEPSYAKIAEETFSKNGIKNAEVIIGDAKESLKSLPSKISEPYDLVFIDADKVSYPAYLTLILSLSTSSSSTRILRPGGIILADNILRRALIADSTEANPWKARAVEEKTWRQGDIDALKKFNDMMVESERLETFLMPMFDGLGCALLKD